MRKKNTIDAEIITKIIFIFVGIALFVAAIIYNASDIVPGNKQQSIDFEFSGQIDEIKRSHYSDGRRDDVFVSWNNQEYRVYNKKLINLLSKDRIATYTGYISSNDTYVITGISYVE